MKRVWTISFVSFALAGCSLVPGSDYQPHERDSASATGAPARTSTLASSPRVGMRPAIAMREADAQCLTQLSDAGASFDALPDEYTDHGCSTLNTVQMHALQGDGGRLNVSNLGPVTCPVSAAFAGWARFGVDRAARQIFGQPLASIQTMGSYSCRNVAGTSRRSGHASAAAIDIGGFVLADGRRISVAQGWNGNAQEREFLRVIQRSACRRFNTVLGPDYNAAHRDHFHVEGVIDGNSYCR